MPAAKLGFGVSGPLGQFWFPETETAALVGQALAGGVTHFDTAPFYFDAEARLGRALAQFSATAFVSTKTGTRREGGRLTKDFSERGIRLDVEASLGRLGRNHIDLLYLHGPTTEQMAAAAPVLNSLKREGLVRAIGVCGEGAPLMAAALGDYDAIMGVHNVIDRRNEAAFAAGKARGILTVGVAPLAQGLFDPRFSWPESPSDLWRMARAYLRPRYPVSVIKAARRALGAGDPVGRALAFALADPAVDLVMTTTTKPRHLAASLAAPSLDADQYEELKALTLDRRGEGS